MSDRCFGNEEKNAFVADVVMSSNFPNPFCNSYLGFGLNLSGHVEGSGAADGGARGEGGSGGGEKEGSRELHGYRLVSTIEKAKQIL